MSILREKIIQERTVRNQQKAQISTGKNSKIKEFSWVFFFAGEEFNQELTQNFADELNTIDFSSTENKKGEWVEKEIKKINNDNKNKQLINNNKYPIIWFKGLEKIKKNSALEKSLLPVFDPQQNSELFTEKIDLSNYILVATSATRNMGELSTPLTSRLDCVNVETTQPKRFFLDKYWGWLLGSLLILIFMLAGLIFWPNKKRKNINEKKLLYNK